jgi:hypothetical protein
MKERTIDLLCPIALENIPIRKSATPFPADINANSAPQAVWDTPNSSSSKGAIGAKIVRTVKVRNQNVQKRSK